MMKVKFAATRAKSKSEIGSRGGLLSASKMEETTRSLALDTAFGTNQKKRAGQEDPKAKN